jgi:imidazolonepropionase-like amidohydrolase
MKVRTIVIVLIAMGLTSLAGGAREAPGPEAPAEKAILITNVNVFNGVDEKLHPGLDVLIKGNRIEAVGEDLAVPEGATVIDGGGRTLTPGFIDAHTHIQWNVGVPSFLDSPPDYHAALALVETRNMLHRGFTTARDVGGSVWGVKKAIDEGHHPGPRIYSSGAAIGMTAGHGDYRTCNCLPRQLGGPAETEIERLGMCVFADGVPEMLTACRMQFRNGAHFLKLFVGGAVSGKYDPLDVVEYSLEEVKAAAGEARRWNTYLAVHTYTDVATRQAIEAGAKTLEHANLISEDTVKLAVEKRCYISAQAALFLSPAPDSFTPAQKARQKQACRRSGQLDAAVQEARCEGRLRYGHGGRPRAEEAPEHGVHPSKEVVLAGGDSEAGHLRQRGDPGPQRATQPLPGEARSHRGGRAGRSPRDRWRSSRGHQHPDPAGREPRPDHERREDLQEQPDGLGWSPPE